MIDIERCSFGLLVAWISNDPNNRLFVMFQRHSEKESKRV